MIDPDLMTKNCPYCRTEISDQASICCQCGNPLRPKSQHKRWHWRGIVSRITICLLVIAAAVILFYVSLLETAQKLNSPQRKSLRDAITLIETKGFTREAFLLEHVAVYRSSDNWLNSSVAKENAYAATNFPFEIITLYADFFTYPKDDVERAAILLHEAKHLEGADEQEAYEFVWRNRKQLGWTSDLYRDSPVWDNVRHQTRELIPELFSCALNEMNDCTGLPINQ